MLKKEQYQLQKNFNLIISLWALLSSIAHLATQIYCSRYVLSLAAFD